MTKKRKTGRSDHVKGSVSRAGKILAGVRALPSAGNVDDIYRELSSKPGVAGCYIGFKTSKGRKTRTRSIVCLVTQKVPDSKLDGPLQTIPPVIQWEDAQGKRHQVTTDVVELQNVIQSHAAFAGPGDNVQTGRGEVASVGIALRHPAYGQVITTAAHALTSTPGITEFQPTHAPRVRIAEFRGGALTCEAEVLKVHLTDKGDYALLRPIGGVPCANLYRDKASVNRPYIPGPGDLGREAVVLGASAVRRTFFRGVHARLLHHSSGITMTNLLLTDRATEPGDSGACLADVLNGDLRVWGLLVGSATIDGSEFSVFTTALSPILLEQADYIS